MQVPCVNKNTCITPPIHALKNLKHALGGSAVGYLDKNNRLLFVSCPIQQPRKKNLLRNFWTVFGLLADCTQLDVSFQIHYVA